jgi:hypothetical protein
MARLKRILKSALDDRSPRFMLATLALGVVIALIAGVGIGYKVEQSRIKPAKKATGVRTTPTTGKKPNGLAAGLVAAPDLTAAAFAPVRKNKLFVVYGNKQHAQISVGPKTRVAIAHPAKASSIAVGKRVVFQPSSASSTTATEVVVLPKTAAIGVPVTAVVPGTSMTLKSLKGPGTVVKTTGAPVLVTGPGSSGDIAKGSRLVVRYFRVGVKKRAAAVYIVVLPKTSKFH